MLLYTGSRPLQGGASRGVGPVGLGRGRGVIFLVNEAGQSELKKQEELQQQQAALQRERLREEEEEEEERQEERRKQEKKLKKMLRQVSGHMQRCCMTWYVPDIGTGRETR